MRKQFHLFALTLLLPTLATWATDGFMDVGFGAPAKGVGGAAVAFPQDTLTALANPANLAPVGTRVDVYGEYIRGTRKGRITGADLIDYGGGLVVDVNGKRDLARNRNLIAAEAGGALGLFDNKLALGLLIAPQTGGTITWNEPDPYSPFPVQDVHITVTYVSATPTFALQLFNCDFWGKHTIGAGVDLTAGRIKVAGMQLLQTFGGPLGGTIDPNAVTNNGPDWAFGWAVRVGWLGQIRDWLSLGVSFRTKTYMGRFDKYRGLLTPFGRCDLPAQLFGGIALKPFQQTTIAFDVGNIFYGNVDTFGNKIWDSAVQNKRGGKHGAGFGWHSTMVYKVGICQDITDSIKLRAGYNYGALPWRPRQIDNISGAFYLPFSVRHHLTVGASLAMQAAGILSASFVYGFKHEMKGTLADPFPGVRGGTGRVSSDMYELEIGLSKVW